MSIRSRFTPIGHTLKFYTPRSPVERGDCAGNPMWALMFLLQTGGWSVTPASATVGDTVLIERIIPLEGVEARARIAPLEVSETVQPLGPPRITYESSGVRVQFAVAAFTTDSLQIDMPDIELIFGDGSVRSVAGETALVVVGSVLPAVEDSIPEPRPSQAPIGRSTTDPRLPVLFPLVVVLLTALWGVVRRRRRPRPSWDPGGPDVVEPPVSRWIQVGEPRAVAALAMVQLRERVERTVPEVTAAMSVEEVIDVLREHYPDGPLSAFGDSLYSLERASFAPAVATDVLEIVEAAEASLQSLEQSNRPEPVPAES